MGAWIETRDFGKGQNNTVVAPYMGAWIETRGLSDVLLG